MKNESTSSLYTKRKTLLQKDFLKVVSPRTLEVQRCGSDSNGGKQIAHPKKKCKTSIYKSPIFDNVNEKGVSCVDEVCVNDNDVEACVSCVDQVCGNENDAEKCVTNQKDLNFQILNEIKIIDVSNAKVVRQDEVIVNDKTVLIPKEVTNEINQTLTKKVIERTANSQSRPPMTEEQKRRLREVQSRTVFIDGYKDELCNYFKRMPRKLNKEIIEKSRGQVENVFITKEGLLKIIAKDEAQKNQLLKIQSLNDKPVKTSVPFSLTHPSVSNKKPYLVKKHETEYFVKGVVFGLRENRENLDEIALEVGAHHISRLGNPEFSNATLIAYPKGTILPEFLEVDGRRYRVHIYVPKPLRCDRCQFYGHRTLSCTRDVVCSRCAGNHSYVDCLEKTKLRCANCGEAHSAAYRSCAVYIKMQAVLKIRAEQNITFADAMIKVDELENKNDNTNVTKTNTVTYASKVKTGVENKTEVILSSIEAQTPTDVQITSNRETSLDDLTKRFLSFNDKDYQAINISKSVNNTEDDDPITKMKKSFVLGVLATIDRAKSRKHAQFIICQAASEILFAKEIEFRYKDW